MDYGIDVDFLERKYNEEKEKYLLINNGKGVFEQFNIRLLPNFNNYKDLYIDQNMKFMDLIVGLDMTNLNIIESHNIWNKIINEHSDSLRYNTYLYNRIRKINDYIVYDIKYFVDEVIAFVAVLKGFVLEDKIIVSSIGDYIKKKDNDFNDLDEYIDFFNILNDLHNCYKHSYVNSDCFNLGKDENCFIGLYSKYNKMNEKSEFYVVSVDNLINRFNKFYKFIFDLIDRLTKEIV